MKNNNRKADIFIDAFTGGGKIALSVPYGWYDTIVMNDLNYGVYSFYKYCKEDYVALIKMVDKLAEVMCKDNFHIFAYLRNFGKDSVAYNDPISNKDVKTPEGYIVDSLAAAAMTYWVTASSFNGISDPVKATYSLHLKKDINDKIISKLINDSQENKKLVEDKQAEINAIEKIKKAAHKRIPELNRVLNRKHIIIENLDYRELIKKYNGFAYKTLDDKVNEPEEQYKTKGKLWYFDPPYHPYTLAGGKNAPYNDTFTVEMSEEMVDILAGKKETEYGALEYFIKSDYDTQEALERAKESEKEGFIGANGPWYKEMLDIEAGNRGKISEVFKPLEVEPFKKICLGGFDKGAIDEDNNKTVGYEYIWCRGF